MYIQSTEGAIKRIVLFKKERVWVENREYSLMQAIMLMAPLLSFIMSNAFGLSDNNVSLIAGGLSIIYIYSIMNYGFPKIKLSSIMLVFGVMAIYLISYLFYHGTMTVSLIDMFFYFIFSYLVMLKPAPIEKLLSDIIMISLLALPFVNTLFTKSNTSNLYDTISMGLSYSFVPSIIAAFLHYKYYFNKKNLFALVGYIANIYYMYNILTMGYRGPVIALIFPIILVFLFPFNSDGERILNKPAKYYLTIVAILIILVIALVNYEAILFGIYSFFASKNINIAFLAKTQLLSSEGDLSHGRLPLLVAGLSGFLESPFWGNGIGVFGYKVQIGDSTYPHNLFVQLLYDGGVFLTFPILYYLISGSIRMIKSKNLTHGFAIFVLLSCTSLPRLMVSANMWKTQSFWMLLWFLIINTDKLKSDSK